MKAIVRDVYGSPDVLRLEERPKPATKEGEVLVRIHATSINQADWHLLTADIFLVRLLFGGLRTPAARSSSPSGRTGTDTGVGSLLRERPTRFATRPLGIASRWCYENQSSWAHYN
jgi:hypothetical protein